LKDEIVEKTINKKLAKKINKKRMGLNYDIKKTWEGWNLKKQLSRTKKNAIKRIVTKLERLKNHGRWNWKLFIIWYIIYKLKNYRSEI